MSTVRTWLLLILVVLVAIGVGLYANELRRQANIRVAAHAAAIAAEREQRMSRIADLQHAIEDGNRIMHENCHPNIKADRNARVDTPAFKEYVNCEIFKEFAARDKEKLKSEELALKTWETFQH
jgi:hypothetical protein